MTRDFVCDGLDADVSGAFEAALQKLSQAGANIVSFRFPELREIPRINAGGGLTAAEAWTWHRKLLQAQGTCYDHRVAQRIRRGAEQSATDYIEILAARKRVQAVAAERLRDADAWLMPTVAITPPLVAALERDDDAFFAANGMVLRNTNVINFLDGCATSLPTGEPGIGLSVCGLHDQDARVLQISAAIQALY